MNDKKKYSYIDAITHIAVALVLVILSTINSRMVDIDSKLFTHLTNHEMHTPQSIVVTKAEFSVYQNMRDKQMMDIKDLITAQTSTVKSIESLVIKHMDKTKKEES